MDVFMYADTCKVDGSIWVDRVVRLNTIYIILRCAGGTSKKGHKWPFSVCVNLKKDPNRHLRPQNNMHSTIIVICAYVSVYSLRNIFVQRGYHSLNPCIDKNDIITDMLIAAQAAATPCG